jgi:hypothetical protein
MYFYDITSLKDRLTTGPLPERESLPYLVVFVTLCSIVMYLPIPPENAWDYFEVAFSTFSIVVSIIGTIYLYRANGGEKGRDFIHRYIVLGWVVAVRFISLFIPIAIVLSVTGNYIGVSSEQTNWFDVLVIVVFEIVFYLYFARHLRELSLKAGT